ncbi:MAG: hypothetical protein ACK5RL_21625, partial [Acidimicrobiales bacterium]
MTLTSPDPTRLTARRPRRGGLIAAAVALVTIRVVVVGMLAFGPWTDEADELAGWDVERFQVVAGVEGQPYVD